MRLTGELAAVRPEELTVLPSGLDPEAAALAFQADVALLGVRAAEIVLGDTVLVMGQGTIGILAVQFARLAGARRVIAADLCDRRLEISRRTGTDVVLNAGAENVPERVRELTAGRGADVVLEASGAPAALVEGARAAAPLARIAVLGWMMAPLQLNLAEEFTPKGLALVVVHSGRKDLWRRRQRLLGAGTTERELEGQDRQFIFELLAAGRLQAQPLVTHRFRLSELARAWEFVDGHAQEYTQVLLVGGEAA
jgi:threonine dehydrogenase-like Zn-dependent dehydrogenase